MTQDTAEVVRRFDAAFNRHDLSALADLVTEDCVFESTRPPDGERIVGRPAVLEAWAEVMADATGVRFEVEEMITSSDRVGAQDDTAEGCGCAMGCTGPCCTGGTR